jgi:tetrahydromethanopterin S-methyltransferase subunit B
MRKLSLILCLVFTFNSTAIFAKAVQADALNGKVMVEKLEKQLEKEQKRKRKTDLVKAQKKYTKVMNKAFKVVRKKVVKFVKLNNRNKTKRARKIYNKYLAGLFPYQVEVDEHFKGDYDLQEILGNVEQMRVHNLEVLNRLFDQASNYEQFLSDLIAELKMNIDSNGYFLSHSRASIDSVPMTLVGAIVLGVAQLAFFGLIIGVVVFAVFGIIRLIRG